MNNRKIITIVVIIFMSTSFAIQHVVSIENQSTDTVFKIDIQVSKKWTFMFYADSDFQENYGGLSDIISYYMSSSDNSNILVLQYPNPDPASIWFIDEDHKKIFLEDICEISIGNYTSYSLLI